MMSRKKPQKKNLEFMYRDMNGEWYDEKGKPIKAPKGPEWCPCMIEEDGIRIFKFILN